MHFPEVFDRESHRGRSEKDFAGEYVRGVVTAASFVQVVIVEVAAPFCLGFVFLHSDLLLLRIAQGKQINIENEMFNVPA